MAFVNKGEYKFLIHQSTLRINEISAGVSPMHFVYAFLVHLIDKPVAMQIFDADAESDKAALANRLIGRAVLGGCCTMIQEKPPIFKYSKPSGTVVPATADDFNSAQDAGHIVYDKFYEYQTSSLFK